ncbi:protein C3orf33 homolog [Oppia nitens]|uniref:protein C3orf33 homolog n=1 Tax=Oppia nitens TaxID=1686743 RepID=UPI0023DC3CC9|nr:protein C3orf33 homolog [Oppia nitens]
MTSTSTAPSMTTKSLIEMVTNYMDNHLMEARLAIGAVGIIGAGIALRGIRFATKFSDNKKIPKSFIRKQIRLRGVVKSVANDGSLDIDHIPLIAMPWHKKNDKLLSVSLAAIRPTISGTYWLKLNAENRNVWFKVIHKRDTDLLCVVSPQKKILSKKSLNAELVERGLASVVPLESSSLSLLARNKAYSELHKSLVVSQTKAKRNNSGIWYKPTKLDQIKHSVNYWLQSVKQLVRN